MVGATPPQPQPAPAANKALGADATRTTWISRTLTGLADRLCRYPRLFFYPQAVLFLVSILYTVAKLEFDTNRNHLLGEDKVYHQAYLKYRREFAAQDELVVIVESEDIEKNRQFVERLGARLEAETNLFTDVFYKGDLKLMGPKALLFVTNETILVEMAERLREARPVLDNFARVTNLNSLFRTITAQIRSSARDPEAQANQALLETLPALGRIAEQAADALSRPGSPPSPGITALFGGGEQAEQELYITFASNRIYLATARPLNERLNKDAVHRLRELMDRTRAEVPGVNVGLTGGPVLELDEMAQAQKDTFLASIVSLVLCALLFIYGYHETGRPVKAVVCLVVGLAYTLAYATATVGHLNILTITFLPILIGLAIDFGIHLVSRYEEELRHGRTERQALEIALVNTGKGIFTGCFTTAGAFLAMGLTDFKGIREMGLICGGGLLLCLVPMFTLLPVLLLRGRQNILDQLQPAADPRARLERLWLNRPGFTLGLAVTVTLLAAGQLRRVWFDHNLLNLQSADLSSVVYEHKLINHASRSVIFGVVTANSLEEARELQTRLDALPTVAGVDSMVNYLTEDQTGKLALVRQIRAHLAGLRFPDVDPDPVNLAELRQTIRLLQAYVGLGASLSDRGGEEEISETLRGARAALARLNAAIADTDPETAAQKLGDFQRALLLDLHQTLNAIKHQDDTAPLRLADIPAPLRHRFISKNGDRYLLQVNPRSNVWERVNQETFVREIRQLAPDVTGEPVQLYEYITLLKDSYLEAAYYALAAVVVLVFIHFRSLTCVILALLPVGLGMLWTAGFMGWAGVPFNPANIMTLPLAVGIGVTNGIHVLNRFAEEGAPTIFGRSTGKAVLLSALTTVAGFGSLMLAQHRGIASLGLLMSISTTACMVVGVVVLPAVLTLLLRRGWRLPGGHGRRPDGAVVPEIQATYRPEKLVLPKD